MCHVECSIGSNDRAARVKGAAGHKCPGCARIRAAVDSAAAHGGVDRRRCRSRGARRAIDLNETDTHAALAAIGKVCDAIPTGSRICAPPQTLVAGTKVKDVSIVRIYDQPLPVYLSII